VTVFMVVAFMGAWRDGERSSGCCYHPWRGSPPLTCRAKAKAKANGSAQQSRYVRI
jgi:hypothetical protein